MGDIASEPCHADDAGRHRTAEAAIRESPSTLGDPLRHRTANAGPGLAGLVGRALTGRPVPLPPVAAVPQIASALCAAGWSGDRLGAIRAARLGAGQPWPFPLTAAERGDIGAAQLHSAVQAVEAELGLGPVVRLRDRHVEPDARDRALQAERPPHHGSVG